MDLVLYPQLPVSMNAISTMKLANWSCAIVAMTLAMSGCRSSSHAQRSTSSSMSTATMGTSLDDIDARNRADIAAQLGRPVVPGPATPAEVVAMTHAAVDPRFIVSYINRSTNISPITAQDVIYLHDQGVNEQVIQAMLTPGAACSRAEVARAMPPQLYIIGDPWWPYDYPYPRYGFVYGYGYHGCY
jgi:hypothetical protein